MCPTYENDVRHENGRSPRGRYYSRDYRSTSHVLIQTRRRKAMKFAPARTPERFRARKRPRSCTFHENLDFSKFWLHDADPVLHSIFGCANSFFDLTTPFESLNPRNHEKNTDMPNEFTNSENFSPNGVAQMISMFATKTAKHLGVSITLDTTALQIMC